MTTKSCSDSQNPNGIGVGDQVELISEESKQHRKSLGQSIFGIVTNITAEGIAELKQLHCYTVTHVRNLKKMDKSNMPWRK